MVKKMKGKLKSFNELVEGIDKFADVTDEEAEMRAEVFLNGYRMVEEDHRKKINDISFRLNRKFMKGCQARELIETYNELIGQFQDDSIF